jgi:hypothetical protein
MTVISSNEFAAHQEKYFDMALRENLIVQNGENRFIVQNFVSLWKRIVLCGVPEKQKYTMVRIF